jgi:hypothetical protein
MRNSITSFMLVLFATLFATQVMAQQPELQYFRPNDKDGLNMFETPKENNVEFTGMKVRVGGDFAMIFQGLSQENDLTGGDTLVELQSNFSLPTANLNLDVQLADGLRMHVRTYLSSRHHAEAWVKGGFIQMDRLGLHQRWLPEFLDGYCYYSHWYGRDQLW